MITLTHTIALKAALRAVCSLAALCVALLLLVGCAGHGTPGPSPFQGDFSGPWTSTGTHSGTATIHVSVGGVVSGTETDTTISVTGAVNGSMNNNGTFAGTVLPQGGSVVDATGTFQISSDQNTLSGTVVFGGVTYTYTLTRV